MFVKCWGTSRQHFEPMGVGTQSALQAVPLKSFAEGSGPFGSIWRNAASDL